MHLSDTPLAVWWLIQKPCLLERVHKPICTRIGVEIARENSRDRV